MDKVTHRIVATVTLHDGFEMSEDGKWIKKNERQEEVILDVSVDFETLGLKLAGKALHNKNRKAIEAGGCVEVKVVRSAAVQPA